MRIQAGAAASLAAVSVLAAALCGSVPAVADSAESQIRALLDGMNRSYNRGDFDSFAAHVCSELLRAAGYRAGWYRSRRADGPTSITVNTVRVDGDGAFASVRFEAADHVRTLDVEFVREDGARGPEWKACRYHPAQAV